MKQQPILKVIQDVRQVIDASVNKRIEELRKQKRLSQGEFTEELHVNREVIGRIEREQIPVPLALVQNLKSLYGLSYEYLIDGTKNMNLENSVRIEGNHFNNSPTIFNHGSGDRHFIEQFPQAQRQTILDIYQEAKENREKVDHLQKEIDLLKKIIAAGEKTNQVLQANCDHLKQINQEILNFCSQTKNTAPVLKAEAGKTQSLPKKSGKKK